jgi:hypothetical protein
MLKIIGILLILGGIVVILWGDKIVSEDKGIIGSIFSWPPGRAKFIKPFAGAALIYAGVKLLTY